MLGKISPANSSFAVVLFFLVVSSCDNKSSEEYNRTFGTKYTNKENAIRVLPVDPLTGKSWKLVQFEGKSVQSSKPPATSIRFWPNGYLAGFVGCTGFAGGPRWSKDGKLHDMMKPMISQAIECGDGDEPAGPIATAFWKKMQNAKRWKLVSNHLIIHFFDGSEAKFRRVVCGDLGGSKAERECKP